LRRAGPDEDFAAFVQGHSLSVNQFVLQVLQIGVIQLEPPLQRTI